MPYAVALAGLAALALIVTTYVATTATYRDPAGHFSVTVAINALMLVDALMLVLAAAFGGAAYAVIRSVPQADLNGIKPGCSKSVDAVAVKRGRG